MACRTRRNDGWPPGVSWKALVCLGLACIAVACVPGCRGCVSRDPLAERKAKEEAEKKKKEKPKPDFQTGRLQTLPRDESTPQSLVKAGHWAAAVQPMKANNYVFVGELLSAATSRTGEPFEVQHTLFRLTMSRPAALPKGQTKQFESVYFIPHLPSQEEDFAGTRHVWLRNTLLARHSGREVIGPLSEPTTILPPYQYFFVVLSDEPDRYGYLKVLDSVEPPIASEAGDMLGNVRHYHVVLPKTANRVPLPSQPLLWTSIAYVLWDGVDPNLLTPDQQDALLDWLHWGGQVIISGPKSLDLLRGSFLDPYLPARGGQAIGLAADAFRPLDQGWSVQDAKSPRQSSLGILEGKPPVGVRIVAHPDAEALPSTGGLVLERPVGAGRIVVTAFALSDPQIRRWASFDSFFNACLLRRPARRFQTMPDASVQVEWKDAPGHVPQLDGRYVTGVRYFTRDAGPATSEDRLGRADSCQSEVAGWNDQSAVADAARQSLRDAAGIEIPQSGFVFQVLVVYVLVLAPLNWLAFRVVGRVEWAWAAAPLIAMAGAGVVVRLAQLDIGFARSRTELAVLELRGGYPRGHLTRYTALYTSLSTSYDFLFDDDSALAMPFPHVVPYRRGLHESLKDVHFRRERQVSLSGYQVPSNYTGLVHSEQMQALRGSIQLVGSEQSGWLVQNGTDLALQDAGVIRRNQNGRLETAWLGSLEPAASVPLKYQTSEKSVFLDAWKDSPTCYSYERRQADLLSARDRNGDRALTPNEVQGVPELESQFSLFDVRPRDGRLDDKELFAWCVKSHGGQLTLGRLVDLACEARGLRTGEVRLIGWTDRNLPGLTIRPHASQERIRTLILVHLKDGRHPPAQRDENLRVAVERNPHTEPGILSEGDASP